jgi:hypothetical protein
MTLPDERYRAIQRAGDLLLRIAAHPKQTPGVPKRIREEAAAVLRHYPGQHDLAQLEAAAPHVVQQRMEPLHKMVLQYSNEDLRVDDDADLELRQGYRE